MTTAIEYALMAGASYISTRADINQFPVPDGWAERIDKRQELPSGFEATYFTKGTDIVISYAGTDESSLGDIAADFNLLIGIGSKQLLQAAKYYLQVKATNPAAANITFTGHSLGGGLAALMGAFFNEGAFTFDQAPFRSSASSLVANDLLVKLKLAFPVRDYPQIASWLAPLEGFAQAGLAAREGNVTNINVQGEFLSVPPATLVDRIGVETEIPNSANGVAGTDLHSQALLTAFLQSIQTAAPQQTLNEATFKLPDLLKMIFDSKLYRREPKGGTENFLERLVKHEAGVQGSFAADGMVTRFTTDLWKIAQDGGLTVTSNSISKALIAFAMQMYYENASAADVNKHLFTDVTGGIRFDINDVAATLTAAKGYQYFRNYLEILPTTARYTILQNLLDLRDWYIQAGGDAMVAMAGNQRAFMLGGVGDDNLTGSSLADVLVGNAANDLFYRNSFEGKLA